MKWYESLIAFSLFIVVILICVCLPLYANYEACRQYYPKLNPFICMISTKTRIGPSE